MPAQGIKKPSLPCFKGRKTNFSAVPPTFGAQNAAPFYGTGSPMPDPCNGRSPWQPTCPFQPPRSGGNFMPQQPAPASSPGGHSLQSQRCRTTSSVIAVFQIRLYYTEPGAKCQAENQQARNPFCPGFSQRAGAALVPGSRPAAAPGCGHPITTAAPQMKSVRLFSGTIFQVQWTETPQIKRCDPLSRECPNPHAAAQPSSGSAARIAPGARDVKSPRGFPRGL